MWQVLQKLHNRPMWGSVALIFKAFLTLESLWNTYARLCHYLVKYLKICP